MKLIKQLASIFILTFVFFLGYFHPDLYLCGGIILCCLNYIHEDHKRFKATFTPPYSPDKPPQTSLPPTKCNSINIEKDPWIISDESKGKDSLYPNTLQVYH